MTGGVPQAEVLAKWTANAPLAFMEQYVGNLRQYRAIAIDVGDEEGLQADAVKLHDPLDSYEIANIDTNILLERPKLAPHFDAMRANIAEALGISPALVNVKALGAATFEETVSMWVLLILFELPVVIYSAYLLRRIPPRSQVPNAAQ